MTSLKSRVLVAVIGVPLLVAIVLWAPTAVIAAALALLAGIGGMELQQCVSGTQKGELIALCLVFPAFIVLWYHIRPDVLLLLILADVLFLFAYAIVKAGKVKFNQLMAALFGTLAISYSFSAFLRIEAMGLHRAYLLLPFILSFACDTFAYFVGCTIGKHKLAPKVSPKKSVEGSVGGIVGNVLCGLLFAFVMDKWFGGGISYSGMVILALACGIVAQIGDLSFSLIKREFGIKDYGKLFLAHGGVLDRFDSVLFVAPVIEIILQFVK